MPATATTIPAVPTPPPFDLVVFGATGFTGRLVAEYLHRHYGPGKPWPALRWAMAGRSADKLQRVRAELGIGDEVPVLTVDAQDAPAVGALVRQTRVVLTTVGPYQLYGEVLVQACADQGTDYVDLCGEPGWMARMIPLLQPRAAASGARIVFSCGFDSIPFDLGVVYLQHQARQRLGGSCTRVRGRVTLMKGGMSGGTVASLLATLDSLGRHPQQRGVLANPFALTPGFQGPRQPADGGAAYDEVAAGWTGPFVMAAINTKNVHRTNALRGHPWGEAFCYDERMLLGDGATGERRARALARESRVQNLLLAFGPTRALLRRFVLPQPGQGPNAQQRERGRYEVLFIGTECAAAPGRSLRVLVKGDRDPGYGSTCKLISEAALCLVQQVDRQHTPGGVWTPGAAMGLALADRLQQRAGLHFSVAEDAAAPAA